MSKLGNPFVGAGSTVVSAGAASQTVAALPAAPAWDPATGMLVEPPPPVPASAEIGVEVAPPAPADDSFRPELPPRAAPAVPLGAAVTSSLVCVAFEAGLAVAPSTASPQLVAISAPTTHTKAFTGIVPLTQLRWAQSAGRVS